MYRPVSMSKASGNSGKKYTQEAGSFPNPKVMKMAMTIAVKAMDSQRWVCRIHMFQFNGTSSDDKRTADECGHAAPEGSTILLPDLVSDFELEDCGVRTSLREVPSLPSMLRCGVENNGRAPESC